MTIDETINEWTEKRDQLKAEYSRIEVKPVKEMLKHGIVTGTMLAVGFPALHYWVHRQLDESVLYFGAAFAIMVPVLGLISGCTRMFGGEYAEKDRIRMEELRHDIEYHNEILRSMRTAPERYDPEVWYRAQVARLEK